MVYQHWRYSHQQIFALCTIHSLKISEQGLQRIARQQGSNSSDLIDLVKENESTLDTMKARLSLWPTLSYTV